MKKLLNSIARITTSTLMWPLVALYTLVVFLLAAILWPFDPYQKITHHVANLWGKFIIWSNPFWVVSISGKERIKKNKAYVLVSNHNSLADILFLYCLGKHFKWLAKDSLFKIPFFGWTMSLLKYIPIKRGQHGSVRDSFQEAQEWLKRNISVVIFPEGTRSISGNLGQFKNGAFKLAIRSQKPIIPIVIQGTSEIISKGRATVSTRVHGSIHVLPQIEVADFKENDHETLKQKVWDLMNEELKVAQLKNADS
jgi:1-acyl-sn-glycerol-3-phosphate acyltransferase